MTTRVLVPSGVLGLGFDEDALWRGVALCPDIIAIDGGSTDSGPASLGTGTSKYSRASTKSEWRSLMKARAKANVPLVIGTCGTAGTNSNVDWMFEITRELASELGQQLKVARLYSEQPQGRIVQALHDGRLKPLDPAPEVDPGTIEKMTHIVALAGAEQINEALATGADIILAGRTTDTAIIAARALFNGDHPGSAWHGAKIGECGALCTTHPTSGVIFIEFDDTGFRVTPLADKARCTPYSVSAHMLYENADPMRLYEPGGYLDVSAARYMPVDERSVRVEGAEWTPSPAYCVKLEGAKPAGFQTTLLAVLRDPHYVENAEIWAGKLTDFLNNEITHRLQIARTDYVLDLRLMGVNSVLGAREVQQGTPNEVGVLCIVTAQSQEEASEIAKLINPFLLHYPLTEEEELPTFAFPYSPAHSERGAIFEFALNHVLDLDHPMDAFQITVDEI
jgi:hypothetical protein